MDKCECALFKEKLNVILEPIFRKRGFGFNKKGTIIKDGKVRIFMQPVFDWDDILKEVDFHEHLKKNGYDCEVNLTRTWLLWEHVIEFWAPLKLFVDKKVEV